MQAFPVPGSALFRRLRRSFRRVRRSRALLRAGALAGMAGPVGFTAAWIAASLRQSGHSPGEIQISGLAAPGARDPWIMLTGFLALGGCLLAFGPALRHELGTRSSVHDRGASPADDAGIARVTLHDHGKPAERAAAGPAPWLVEAAGVLVIAAGLLRRDHMLLTPGPGSWHNQAHDAVSAAIYALLIAIPLVLARRLRGDPRWKGLPALLTVGAAATAVTLIVFSAAGANSPQAGVLQRAGVSIPLAALVTLAARLRRLAPA